jgi:ribosomal-protein-alanine N-acetyltransferase
MKKDFKIETPRLFLRKYVVEDINDYFEYMSQPEVCNTLGFQPFTDKGVALKRLETETLRDNFAIVYKENNKVIGHVSVFDVKAERYVGIEYAKNAKEIGFLLSKDYWGRGIMPEAVSAVVDYIFSQTPCEEIIIGHKVGNKQSERVQDKIGFKVIAVTKNEDGEAHVARKMTKQDWQSKHSAFIKTK